jgi:hypothetical protein
VKVTVEIGEVVRGRGPAEPGEAIAKAVAAELGERLRGAPDASAADVERLVAAAVLRAAGGGDR